MISLTVEQLENIINIIKKVETAGSYQCWRERFRIPIMRPITCVEWREGDVPPTVIPIDTLEFECVEWRHWRCDKLNLEIRT